MPAGMSAAHAEARTAEARAEQVPRHVALLQNLTWRLLAHLAVIVARRLCDLSARAKRDCEGLQ
jgi:hypothetical protein